MDAGTKATVQKMPTLTVKACPRDGDEWAERLKEELACLIKFVEINKENDREFCEIACNDTGTRWEGKAWFVYKLLKYEFDLEFEIPVTYPSTCPEIALPERDGKTAKMFRGGKICLEGHFKQLWGRNVPKFGIAHALAMGLGPWLAAEVPHLVDSGAIVHKG